MLDIIRKKAGAWIVKIIFGIIIVVFALFFGYNRMSAKYRTGPKGGNIVATVNGSSITRQEFQLAYDNSYKMFQQMFKGKEGEPLPPGMEKSVKTNAVNQLIQQKVIEKIGSKMGLDPSPPEIADAIRKSGVASGEDGKFDPYLYKQRFLPYFAQKFHIDYEYLIANDLLASKTQDIFASSVREPFAKDMFNMEKTQWTFVVTAYDSEAGAKKRKGGSANNYGPIGISDRQQLFPGQPDDNVWQEVFNLKRAGAALKNPVNVGGKWYGVEVTKYTAPTDADWAKERDEYTKNLTNKFAQEFFQEWTASVMKKAKTKSYLEE